MTDRKSEAQDMMLAQVHQDDKTHIKRLSEN